MKKHIYPIFVIFLIISASCKKDLEFDTSNIITFTNQRIKPSPSYGIIYEYYIQNPNNEKIVESRVIVTRSYRAYEENGETIPARSVEKTYASFGRLEIVNDFDVGVECKVTPYVKTQTFTYYGSTTYFVPTNYKKPVIDNISPVSGNESGTITINGYYFSENNDRNRIYIGNKKIHTTSSSYHKITAKYSNIQPGTYDLTLKVGEKEFTLENAFTVH